MISIIELIMEELKAPFKDPRIYRTPRNLDKFGIDNKSLFYMLIDESERFFKVGAIVTATVQRILDKRRDEDQNSKS